MKRFVGLVAVVSFPVLFAVACNGGGVSTGGAENEGTPTPDESGTPGPTPEPTNQAQEIRFVAIGDTGAGYEQQYPVAASINAKCQADGCDFALLLGDNFYNSGVDSPTDPQFYDKFEQPYGGLGFPFFVTLGNHDYGADGAGYEFDKGAHQVAYAQTNPQFILPAEYYSFEDGPATFLALGSNLIFWNYDDHKGKQGDYFSTVLDGSQQPWKIAFGHHPYLSNGRHGNAGEYDGVSWIPIANGEHVKEFFEDYLCGRIDLYISGHDHSRQILPGNATCDATFVVSGAGAKTTDIEGDNPHHFQANTEGFAYFVVSDEKIVIQMLDMSGNVEFEHTMTH